MSNHLDVDIAYLDAAGDGVAHHRGREYHVPFTIPGERVRLLPDGSVQILRDSPHRVVPRCPHFGPHAETATGKAADGPCGGCSWQHIDYAEQLRIKSAMVTKLVREHVPRAPEARPTLAATSPDDPWGYRHKAHFVFGNEPGRGSRRAGALVMGHYIRGSREIIPVRECPVHDARANAIAFTFYEQYAKTGITSASETTPGVLRSLAVRAGANTPELMATLVVVDDNDKRLRNATRTAAERARGLSSLHLNLHPRQDAFVFGRDTRTISGPERMRDTVAGVSFLVSPTAFFQTNVFAAELLVTQVMEAMLPGAAVLDLYAGAGLFALPLARAGHLVTAVEENRAAVADGEVSQRLNRIPADRCRFIARRVESALTTVAAADIVVLDPPRDGCSPPVVENVFGRLRPRRVVYVSCNPVALARELRTIATHGYRIASLQPVDMFPHTAHIETVVVLDRSDTTLRKTRHTRNGLT